MATFGSFVDGNVLTAAELNAAGDWTSYTPSWTASTTNPTIGNGTIDGYYWLFDKVAVVQFRILAGTTTTYGTGNYAISLPVTAATVGATYAIQGTARFFDNSGSAVYNYFCLAGSSTTVNLWSTAAPAALWTPTAPVTMATSDYVVGIVNVRVA